MAATLRDQIKRESYITNEIIIQQEAFKAGELKYCFFFDFFSLRIICLS